MAPLQIKVVASHAVADVLADIGPAFENANGLKLSVEYNPTAVVTREIANGAPFDVAIVTRAAIDGLSARGTTIRETCADVARSGLGVSVRKGAHRPDIGSVEAFKRALLAAKSIVRSKDGASGQYFETLLARLGLAEALRDRIVAGPAGRVAELVARGEAELAVQQISELIPVTGADFAGPFPEELQVYTVFAAGVAAASRHGNAARAFIAALTAPAAASVFAAKGLEPANR